MNNEKIREIAQRAFNMAKNSENPEAVTIIMVSEMLEAELIPLHWEDTELTRRAMERTIALYNIAEKKQPNFTVQQELEYQYDLKELLRQKDLADRPYTYYTSIESKNACIDAFKRTEEQFIEKYSHRFI